ncbi:MAG: hypothetical protein JO023_03475 [Chloroflexi bacterium]|nr:hypothetical protein [Chloroflexota bacterium]
MPLAAAGWVLFSPTVLLDGAVWGQSDAIYTSLLVLCIYWVTCGRSVLAFVAFALAFAFKAQAAFLLPLLVVVYLRRRVSVVVFAAIPLAYVALMLPAVLAGMRWSTALGSYLGQATFYRKLAMNAPTLLALIPNQYYDVFVWVGLGWAAAAVLGIVTIAVVSGQSFSATHWLRLSLALLLVVPYLTPGMHDRFFYPAEIVSAVYAFYVPRRFYLPILITTISLLCYFPYLFNTEIVPIKLLSLIMLIPLGITLYDYVTSMGCATSVRPPRDWYPTGRANGHTSLQSVS